MKTHLSLHQRIRNADGSQQIENLKAIHAYTHARNWPVEEWDNIWDLSDDCSWAHGFGRWRGGYKVYLNSVTEWDIPTFTNYMKVYKLYPDVMGMDPRPLNFSPVHILSSDVIEIADDGWWTREAPAAGEAWDEYTGLTLKAETACTLDGKPATLKPGDRIFITGSDKRQQAAFVTPDGHSGTLEIDRNYDDWGWKVNDIPESDVFEFVPYAD